MLKNTRPQKKNLNTVELKALIELKRDENIIILPADKVNAIMALSTRDYKDKMRKLLDVLTCKPITINPTTYLEKTARNEEIHQPRDKSSKYSKMYELPKIHK
ncbi:hypothetical protein Trydic_g23936 [Trypoxylus dichotomus]